MTVVFPRRSTTVALPIVRFPFRRHPPRRIPLRKTSKPQTPLPSGAPPGRSPVKCGCCVSQQAIARASRPEYQAYLILEVPEFHGWASRKGGCCETQQPRSAAISKALGNQRSQNEVALPGIPFSAAPPHFTLYHRTRPGIVTRRRRPLFIPTSMFDVERSMFDVLPPPIHLELRRPHPVSFPKLPSEIILGSESQHFPDLIRSPPTRQHPPRHHHPFAPHPLLRWQADVPHENHMQIAPGAFQLRRNLTHPVTTPQRQPLKAQGVTL